MTDLTDSNPFSGLIERERDVSGPAALGAALGAAVGSSLRGLPGAIAGAALGGAAGVALVAAAKPQTK